MSLLCVGPCRPVEHGGPRRAMGGAHLCDVCADRLREHLTAIADCWQDMTVRLATDAGAVIAERVRGTPSPGLVINERVSDTMRDATSWLWFVARLVVDERELVGPDDQSPEGLARWLADWHSSWLAAHPDQQLVADIATEARDHARACRRAAYPSGARRLELPWLRCTEHATSEAGERIACPGTMFVWANPRATSLPDLICSEDDTHRIDPATWQRAGWRRKAHPDAAATLTRAILDSAMGT